MTDATTQATTESNSTSVSADEFAKVQARAQKFEALATDYEKKFKGVDIEALRAKAEEADILRKEAAVGDSKKIDELIAKKDSEIRKSVEKELLELREGVKTRDARIKEFTVVEKAFGFARDMFNDDCHDDVKTRIRQACDLDEDGSLIVKDKDGKVRYSNAKPSQKLSIDEYLEEIVSERPSWGRAKMTAGGRSLGIRPLNQNGVETGVSLDRYVRMTPQERMSLPPKLRQQYATQVLRSAK